MPAASKKLYFKIGEACRELDIQPYVLRYWETEFPFLSPDKSRSGQRVYTAKELEVIRRIKQLLYEEGYTIAGAKKRLESELENGEVKPTEQADAKTSKEDAPDSAEIDSAADKRVEHLEAGIRSLLADARALLSDLSLTERSEDDSEKPN